MRKKFTFYYQWKICFLWECNYVGFETPRKKTAFLFDSYNPSNNKVHTSALFLIPTKKLASEQLKMKRIFISAHVFIRIHRFLYRANLVQNQLYSLSDIKVNKLYLFAIETYLQVSFLSSIIRFIRGTCWDWHRSKIIRKRTVSSIELSLVKRDWITGTNAP